MNTILDQHTDTTPDRAEIRRQIFVKRRFFALFLPLIVLGAVLYIIASAATLTINGLSLLGAGVIGLGIVSAAWDAGDSR